MTKQDIIEKVRAAADRVMKSAEDAGALSAALDAMSAQVVMAKAGVAGAVVDYETLWKNLRGVYAILDSISMGYPMVPAGGEGAVAKALKGAVQKDMKPEDLVEFAISELEAVSKLTKREEIAPRVICVKAAMMAWEQMPEGSLPVSVTFVDLSAGNGDNKITSQEVTSVPAPAGTYGFAKGAMDRADKVAVPVATTKNAPAKVSWARDLAAAEKA